ncbi:hypothetical protein ACU4GR_17625 [Methylobacterium oryzae CBMB20]
MILFTSSTQNIAAPVSGGWSLKAIVREMLNSWLAHHQRLADQRHRRRPLTPRPRLEGRGAQSAALTAALS